MTLLEPVSQSHPNQARLKTMSLEIAFVGAGKMVTAIVQGILKSNTFQSDEIACCSANDGTSEKLASLTNIKRFTTIEEMLAKAPATLVLGCKPQQLSELPLSVAENTSDCLILSIMAGITLNRLEQTFPKARNIVRSMPNTPGQIGEGASGYFFLSPAEEVDKEVTRNILSSLGQIYLLHEESDLDRITAISGSGPAYIFEFTCALEEAAKEIGLSPEMAKELAHQTVIGSAKLMEASTFSPEELRNQVTSPNGTTQAALESFSADELREIVKRATTAARNRSIELSNA
ncbi:MAG: pyrroline-5-carboxylate reductase [Verrucomicrobia bacterium TMED44]|nr:MAG: pyrroline-5-carboxylate reductase [Verrucomicrobia bacterium TMED44]